MTTQTHSKCRGCGKPIVWASTDEGKKIPLDPRPAVYHAAEDAETGRMMALRDREYMVTHFATCPKAADFSASRKKDRQLFDPQV